MGLYGPRPYCSARWRIKTVKIVNMIDTLLKNKIALVTGANHGIGAAIAKALAKQGVKVFITYLRASNTDKWREPDYVKNQSQTADKIVSEIQKNGGKAVALEADLADVSTFKKLFDEAEKALGPVEILINNAAYCNPDTFEPKELFEQKTGATSDTVSLEQYEQHFAVNTRAAVFLIEELTRRHVARKASWGRIINISTDWADCFPTEISYGASKAATEAYSRAAAVELGKYGITVNIIGPGPIQTGWMSKEVETNAAQRAPLKRVGFPEDIADVVVFLASEQARWLTGQRLFVGGGNRII
ncbi:MAG: 3-ketoacyl-(acyl-carrier-protein) reductase [Candidatus Curtissbacteria bacterium GW2011_GWA1_40_16]|uniref:3-ketoacyl-(Acyl-carrier-protein) reductase n=1 Tax=Candidatus Curtissbacteria bacterium GW2011_GWA1_40_16 TaxID=1618405 RepID=A0A0G0RC51_9BACT|nr:MAG: 3-ketoacyl-(acyl-carrier-protein) reductase [Candidatus Curtissbacteria bacterium GW2011_GWA1_40_16]